MFADQSEAGGEKSSDSLGGMTGPSLCVRVLNDDSGAAQESLPSHSYGSWHSFITAPMGTYGDERSHIHPLITFLSICVNARCILLIQTTVFITSNGLRERKEEGREGARMGGGRQK